MPALSLQSMLSNIIDRIRLPFRKDKELYLALYDILGFYPHKITYYKVALMHKSLGHRATAEELKVLEGKKGKKAKHLIRKAKGKDVQHSLGRQLNNERLEFLGDAILDAVVGDIVYKRYPGKPEGFLTNTRSKLVQRETLGKLAVEMGVNRLILSSGRSFTHNSYIGGNAFEALVGAVYLDRGFDACYKFWQERVMGKYLNVDKIAYKEMNFKSKMLEWSQKNHVSVEFRLEEQTTDSNGSPKFVYTVTIEGVDGCKGEGFSKKESQQHACELTLKKLRNDSAFLDSIFAAKTQRTMMEEMPISVVPDVEENADELVKTSSEEPSAMEKAIDEMTLDDVKTEEASREDIIAAAEAEAYKQAAE